MNIAVKMGRFGLGAATTLAVLAMPAMAQLAGVSHPEDTAITNAADKVQPETVYLPYTPTPATPALKPRVTADTPANVSASADDVRRGEPMAPDAVPDVDEGIVTRLPGSGNELPLGTLLRVKMRQEISTRTTLPGTVFTAALTEAVERDGHVLLPVGTVLSGVVTDVHGGRRISGSSSIHLLTTSLMLPDGTSFPVHAQVIDTSIYKQTKVDTEGTIFRRDHAAKTASALALTTGAGAASGAVLGGLPGAVIGAGVGAGISTIVWLKQDRQTELPVATKIVFALTQSMTLGPVVNAGPVATK